MADSTATQEWYADYDRGTVERELREQEARREKFKWYHLVRRTILESSAEKHVLRCLADHAQAGPDLEGQGRRDGECVLLVRTICTETGLPERTVRRAITELVKKRIIERVSRGRRGGGRGASAYRICPSNVYER